MKILFIIPGDINLPTGGYRYDRTILECWEQLGINHELISLDGDFPFPTNDEMKEALDRTNGFPEADIAIIDGLAGGVLPDFLEALASKMRVVALIHHPLCLENGLSDEQASQLEQSEAEGLRFVTGIITSSATTAETVKDLFQVTVPVKYVEPGVERGEPRRKRTGGNPVNLLCVGSVIERKGHQILFEALSELKEMDWHLNCIGKTDFDTALYEKLETYLVENELSSRVSFHGAVDASELKNAYQEADLFVLPSLYEGYGMVYAEAIVRGIPVIATTAGAIPKTVPDGCGLLALPNDVPSLKDALRRAISDENLRNKMHLACKEAEPDFPTWENSAKQMAEFLESVA